METINKIKNFIFPQDNNTFKKSINNLLQEKNTEYEKLRFLNDEYQESVSDIEDKDFKKALTEDYKTSLSKVKNNISTIDNKVFYFCNKIVDNLKKSEDLKYKEKLSQSLNKKRHEMPQIDSDSIGDFLLHFGEKVGVKKIKKNISRLKPTQNELNEDKVYSCISNYFDESNKKNRFIISKDNYLLDGHHRWAADLEMDSEQKVSCYKINLPIKELLSRANRLKISNKKDINDIEKSLPIINLDSNDIDSFKINEQYVNHLLVDERPIGIKNEIFIESNLKLSKAFKDNLISEDIIEKAVIINKNKTPVRRLVRREDGTTFAQIFWVTKDEENIIDTKKPTIENSNENSKKLFKEQEEKEKIVKVGDSVKVKFIGSVTNQKYEFENFKVVDIKNDRIIVETLEVIHTKKPIQNPVSFRKGQRFEIPKTNNSNWSEFQNFELKISEEELKKRMNDLISSKQIEEANRKGFRIFPELVGKDAHVIQAHLLKFKQRWEGLNPFELFEEMKSNIDNHFGDQILKSNYTFNVNKNTGTFSFDIEITGKDGERLMQMTRTDDNLRHQFKDDLKKGIYHNYFVLNPKFQGGGLAKKLFCNLYKQYDNANLDYLAVTANISVGGYTWGSMGFHSSTSQASSFLSTFSGMKNKLVNIKSHYLTKGQDGVEDFKIDNNKVFIKKTGEKEFKDVSNEKIISPKDQEEYNKLSQEYDNLDIDIRDKTNEIDDLEKRGNNSEHEKETLKQLEEDFDNIGAKISKLSKVKRYDIQNKGIVDLKKSETYTITEKDISQANSVFSEWQTNNQGSTRFPVHLFCGLGNKKAGQAFLLGSFWSGTINLKDQSEREHFEKSIGFERNKLK